MGDLLLIGLLVLAGIAVMAMMLRSGAQQSDKQIAALRQEMQTLIGAQVQSLSTQVGQVAQSVTQQLGQVRQELQTGVASSGQLAAEAQRDVAQRLESSTEAIRQISQQIGEVQKTSQDLSQASAKLESVLSGAKSRGSLGEIALERLLEDALPRAAYEIQYRFATGSIVDAIVRSNERLLSIDSKFPLDAYRRLIDGGEESRKEFSQAVRKHSDAIAAKYILPDEHTLDFALMFVPSEGVYYELLLTEDSKYGRLDEYCRGKKVFPVSPNTCYAYLCAIATSLRGLKMEENARHLLASFAGLQRQIDSFAETHEKLGTHLRNAQQTFNDASGKLERARNSLDRMSDGALPDASPKTLEVAPTTLFR